MTNDEIETGEDIMSTFLLSCTTCALRAPGRDELIETLNHAPAAGFRYWGVAGPLFWTPGVPRWVDSVQINRMAGEAGMLGMTEVYASSIPTESESAAQRYVENSLVHSARLAEALKSSFLVFSGGKRDEGTTGLDYSLAGINLLLPMIEDLDIKIALEPHYQSRFHDTDDFGYIFERVNHPKVGITVDTGHFHSAGVDTKALIRKYRSKIFNIHLKDHVGTQSVSIGEGEIDLKGIFSVLMEIGYSGALALEIEPEDTENLPAYVRASHSYITGLLDELGADYE